MTILIKYPQQTEKTNEDFFKRKDQELTTLDWAKWSGWFDTDGFFTTEERKGYFFKRAGLRLKDRPPVELFSKTFETSLTYHEHKTITPEPSRKEYIAKEYLAKIHGSKAVWFTKNVYPYLIKEEKKDYAARLLGYRPESKYFTTWTRDEVVHYLATAIEGDGTVSISSVKTTKIMYIKLYSSNIQYLSNVKYIMKEKLALICTLSEHVTYKTREGEKTMYILYIPCGRTRPDNLKFLQSLVKDGVMTLDRKKQKVQEYMTHVS